MRYALYLVLAFAACSTPTLNKVRHADKLAAQAAYDLDRVLDKTEDAVAAVSPLLATVCAESPDDRCVKAYDLLNDQAEAVTLARKAVEAYRAGSSSLWAAQAAVAEATRAAEDVVKAADEL